MKTHLNKRMLTLALALMLCALPVMGLAAEYATVRGGGLNLIDRRGAVRAARQQDEREQQNKRFFHDKYPRCKKWERPYRREWAEDCS